MFFSSVPELYLLQPEKKMAAHIVLSPVLFSSNIFFLGPFLDEKKY
jgi:hypothetical protein